MKWLVGLVLGALGLWALGWLRNPSGSQLATGSFGQWLGLDSPARGGPAALNGPTVGGREPSGMLLDERLTRRARERLAERGADDPRVDLTTVDGVMYLRGRPRDARAAAQVVDVAETTPGVTQVVNELKPLDEA